VYQLTNLYRPLGGPDVPEPLEAQEYFPWELSQLVAGKTMAFSSVENAPPEAAKDKESWRRFEIKSVLDIPLVTDSGAVLGFLTFAATREEREWPEVITKQLQLVAQVFLNVLLRKRAEQTLHESKELLDIQKRRLSEAQRIAHLGSWTFDKATGATTWSEELYRMTGLERTNGDLTREARRSRFTEDSLARLDEAMATARANEGSFEVEAEMIRSNGEHFSATCRGEPLRDGDGKVIGFHGTIQDTTERKSFEQKLYELSGRLLNLQDEERRTIARNLHDQTAQNLALLNINLALLQKLIPSDKEDINNLVDQSFQLIKQSLKEVRTLSYLLHPPMLDEGGLIAALRWYIGGFSKRSSIVVRFEPDELCEKLPGEIEDTLYRVVQESLSNIHLHSGSKTADVELKCDGSRVVLRIADSGHGFPAPVDISRRDDYRFLGMGLMGMRQRVCQHGGDLKIESDKSGTRITAQIPLRGAA
jgi:PAS domain S-box-containing protein